LENCRLYSKNIQFQKFRRAEDHFQQDAFLDAIREEKAMMIAFMIHPSAAGHGPAAFFVQVCGVGCTLCLLKQLQCEY
jgi:hypothetical protein